MNPTRKRVAVPFLFRAADGLGAGGKLIARAYGATVEGVLTRAGAALAPDGDARLFPHPYGLPRLAHDGGEPSLSVEGPATNYLLRSQEFDNASWSKSNVTVTANQVVAPDGTTTGDKVEVTAGGAATFRQVNTTIATTVATFTIYGCIGSGATDANKFLIWNETTAATLANCTINWTTGVVTPGTGTASSEDAGVHNGVQWWRIILTATTGITSGHDLACYGCYTGGAETANEYAYLWQADLTPDSSASSPVLTTSAVASRVRDLLYFPMTLPPQEATFYCRYVHRGSLRANTDEAALAVSTAGFGTPRFALGLNATPFGGNWQASLTNGSTVTSDVGAAKALGDVVEMRGVLSSTATVLAGESINGAAETLGSVSGAATSGMPTAWSDTRLYVGTAGTFSADPGSWAFTHICIALGTKTMAEMRLLAEVG